MPAFSSKSRKMFELTIVDGLPQAIVENVGDTQRLSCCPLCGCMHQISGTDRRQPFTPLCQTLPALYKAQQVIWHKLYPAVAQYEALKLVDTKRG